MNHDTLNIGYGLCGSFCTLTQSVKQMEQLATKGHKIYPIMSPITYSTDTRFGTCKGFIEKIEKLSGQKVMHTIAHVEPIGPKSYLDILVVAPCTGNTIGKLANGIYDTSITLAIKAQLRNKKPVVLAVATNDGLANSAQNIGRVMNLPNVYLVPMGQDDPLGKPDSLIADFGKLEETIQKAMLGEKVQPAIF